MPEPSPSPTALFIITEGFEELEAVAPLDILRRAEVDCTLAATEPTLLVTGRNQIRVQADVSLDTALRKSYDLVVIPGGPGVASLRKDDRVISLVRNQFHEGRLVAAICAGPLVLLDAGVLEGKRSTAHGSVLEQIPGATDEEPVVEDMQVITSRGAGTAVLFGLILAKRLVGVDKANAIASSIHSDNTFPIPS